MKICPKCKTKKINSHFSRDKRTLDGRHSWCKKCESEREKAHRLKNKELVLNHYGKICNCCGETELLFLSIDHVNNDGYKHTKSEQANVAKQVVKAGFPDTYQILCMNCNFGKARNKGICPHVGERI